MIPGPVIDEIVRAVGQVKPDSVAAVGGGSINRCYRLVASDGCPYFVKLGEAGALDMFEAERDGLVELAGAEAVRVPAPVRCARVGAYAYLLMEYVEFGGKSASAAARLGAQLAAQHRRTADAFGWRRDNTIGSTPQDNRPAADWVEFFAVRRIGAQCDLAAQNGYRDIANRGRALIDLLPERLAGHRPAPSLLHGDLWGGNWSATTDGTPVIFDPAVYYGDRETDIAMTMLFGGFGAEFYAAYARAWPLDTGFESRRELYNLYHVLNHLNLFGAGYLGQASQVIESLRSRA